MFQRVMVLSSLRCGKISPDSSDDKSKIIIYSTDIQEYDVVSVDVQQKGNKINFKCVDKEGLKCGIILEADSSNDEIIDITIYYTDMIIYYRTRVI